MGRGCRDDTAFVSGAPAAWGQETCAARQNEWTIAQMGPTFIPNADNVKAQCTKFRFRANGLRPCSRRRRGLPRSPPLLCARANDRLPETSAATANGRSWPDPDVPVARQPPFAPNARPVQDHRYPASIRRVTLTPIPSVLAIRPLPIPPAASSRTFASTSGSVLGRPRVLPSAPNMAFPDGVEVSTACW